MTPKVCVISIFVNDVPLAKDFYCNKLGFTVKQTYGENIVQLDHDGVPIILEKASGKNPATYGEHAQIAVGIQTDDIHAAFKDYREKGIDILSDEPQTCPPGYYFVMRDPFGNPIEVLQFVD